MSERPEVREAGAALEALGLSSRLERGQRCDREAGVVRGQRCAREARVERASGVSERPEVREAGVVRGLWCALEARGVTERPEVREARGVPEKGQS